MSTSGDSPLSFLRFRARRRGRAALPAGPDAPRPVSQEPLGPGLAALVRVPGRPVPAPPPLARADAPGMPPGPTVLAHALPDAPGMTPEPTILAHAQPHTPGLPPEPTMLAHALPGTPGITPEPTILARTRPGPSRLTPAATVPTVPVPIMAGPCAPADLAVPDEGAETTMLPSRQDAPGRPSTPEPRRAGNDRPPSTDPLRADAAGRPRRGTGGNGDPGPARAEHALTEHWPG